MFRRIITTAAPAARRVAILPRVTPVINARRSYHEKDMSPVSFRELGIVKFQSVLTALELLDHYSNPRNVGSMNKGDVDVGTGLVGAPAC